MSPEPKFDTEPQFTFDRMVVTLKSAENSELLQQLAQAKTDTERGKILGFPESAIQAYVNGTCVDAKELKKIKELYPNAKLLSFRLSQENWQQELGVVNRWAEVLKQKVPYLYACIMQK